MFKKNPQTLSVKVKPSYQNDSKNEEEQKKKPTRKSTPGSTESITVFVRTRPQNDREKKNNSVNICEFHENNSLTIFQKNDDNKIILKKKQFTFDRVFKPQESQSTVYKETSERILNKIIEGFNCSIFAYGQTGAGKTYTMEGTSTEPGIMRRLTKDIFKNFQLKSKKIDFQIRVSFLEIYLEHLHDLIAKSKKIENENLVIREDKVKGVFVQNIVKIPVYSEKDIENIIIGGTQVRTVGETQMNEVSSRSHAVLTLYIQQKDKNDTEGFTKKQSKVHLIDLAGSERVRDTDAAGERLIEGAKINQSLSALGNVINALAFQKGHIPFRDSKLTRLLTDSLGGNSVTLMFVNISPANLNFAESYSSLEFADRAKQIKNKVTISRDPKLKKIAELIEENKKLKLENQKLKKMLKSNPKSKKSFCFIL